VLYNLLPLAPLGWLLAQMLAVPAGMAVSTLGDIFVVVGGALVIDDDLILVLCLSLGLISTIMEQLFNKLSCMCA